MTAGRLVLPALRWRAGTGFDHEAETIRASLAFGAGGFIVFGGTAEAVKRLTADVTAAAGRPLLFCADLERGAGQQFEGLTEFPPPLALASMRSIGTIRWAAACTAREARSIGINWVLAPVADLDLEPDNPIVQSRSFGTDVQRVAQYVRHWVEACQHAGALACVKHYPGHGRTTTDSHLGLPVVEADREMLAAADAVPFLGAIAGDVASVMTAHVVYTGLDAHPEPATFSPGVLGRLRNNVRYDGLIVTDALIMAGARQGRSESDAALAAVLAGCDLLLYPSRPHTVVQALEAAQQIGDLPRERLAQSLARYERALAQANAPARATGGGPFTSAAALASSLVARGGLRGEMPALRTPIDLVVIDDDVGGPVPPMPPATLRELLEEMEVPVGAGGSRVVALFAEPRGWKGRAGLGPDAAAALLAQAPGADLVICFTHPRLAETVPGDAPVLLAWHRQHLMQAAVARWLRERTAPSASAPAG